jgi:prevent-host-death family protein
MDSWSLQDAKAKFSEFVRLVKAHGPHIVTIRGKSDIVVLTMKDYEALQQQQPEKRPSLVEIMRLSSPLVNMDLDTARDTQPVREVDL